MLEPPLFLGVSGSDVDDFLCSNCSRLFALYSGGGDVTSGVDSAVEGGDESAAAASAALARREERNGATSLATSPVLCRLFLG